MASLLLSFAGASPGGVLGPAGALAGRAIGALAGGAIDRALFGDNARRRVEGPRLQDLDVMSSTEGAAIPRLYGRARLSGQVIWATHLEEVISTRTESAGGGKGGSGPRTTTTTYSYFANFAVGLCEGPVAKIGRVWADGKPLDLSGLNVRVHLGTEDQVPDPLINAKEGTDAAPAYRGLAYVVFERLPLENFGNRIPQISVEVVRPVGRLERMIRAITLIPGSTEFGYDTEPVVRALGQGAYAPENRHIASAPTDWEASLDDLQAVCPNLESVSLVVAWFGNDLRAGECLVRPAVDNASKQTQGGTWAVAGRTRANAPVVSMYDGRPAFGGTPTDASIVRAIEDLHARGLQVTFYPFVMMDVPAENALPNPYTGEAGQPPYPWRGQITCDPAPGRPGSPDSTSAAASQVASLFGTAAPGDFSINGTNVVYSGPDEWSLRRMILHYAHLCAAAGGVETFIIGSEMQALTRVRSASGVYPAVSALIALAEDVRAVLGPETEISYAANWSEYGAHIVDAEAQEVRFPLDPLWAADDIDFIGIDYYAPLADWRDGAAHLDAELAESIHDPAYLRANLRGGEFYDFYYVDGDARRAQTRTPIADEPYGKPWIFRAKDLWHWWSASHYERVDGEELPAPTPWVAEGKPIRLTEVGCPAVDKGANEPNVFPDVKSSVGGYPNFSNRRRDDLMQRRYLEAVHAEFVPAFGADASSNPVSSVYAGRMLDPGRIHPWTWDARPYPAFPLAADAWADGPNWETGHWLNGRLGAAPLDDLVAAILADHGFAAFDSARLRGAIDGYVIDRPMSARAAIEPLALAFGFDAVEEGEAIVFRPRGGKPVASLVEDELVVEGERAECRLVRAQETELPIEIALGFTEVAGDYRRAAARSRRLVGASRREARADLAIVASDAVVERAADIWLQDLWAGRERAEFALPPSRIALSPGDVVSLEVRGRERLVEIGEAVDAGAREIRARTIDPEIFAVPARPPRPANVAVPAAAGPPEVLVLDLPALDEEGEPALQYFAVHASPWPGAISIWRLSGESYERVALATVPAVIGVTLDDLAPGPAHRWDNANAFRVRLAGGALTAQAESAVLNGANAAAIRNSSGDWEVIQFAGAELVGERTYLLSRLLRGQLGTDWTLGEAIPEGAPFVLLDRALVPVARSVDLLGRAFSYRVGRTSDDVGSASMTELDAAVTAAALLPWPPAHLRGERIAEGAQLKWTRRARRGDSWEVLDVPLDESTEAYRVEIFDGANVVRTIDTDTPLAFYPNADELADFGAPQTSLSIRVAQLSAVAGPGRAREVVIYL
ncbi:MAG: glycoside hydrolase/phage tail family protein [Bradyrhizobiaceae bacterium]|nr:glycoside hydrolase/phage tail family protein [Bradyrhizobiaceae bacterium]